MNEKFEYNYSSAERDEILAIQKKYSSQQFVPSTVEELRRLDKSTTLPGKIVGWIIGVVGTLVMGTGMSMIMAIEGAPTWLGLVLGIIGMAAAISAYPVYKAITKKQKKKNAPRILELSQKLLEE